jgi:hypothetical protein
VDEEREECRSDNGIIKVERYQIDMSRFPGGESRPQCLLELSSKGTQKVCFTLLCNAI